MKICKYCKEKFNEENIEGKAENIDLCQDCTNAFNEGENKTGYCSLDCIITGNCDESC